MGLVAEARALTGYVVDNTMGLVAQRAHPLSNPQIYAEGGKKAPLVFVGGLTSMRSEYAAFQRYWQARGVATYLVDIGIGHTSVRNNARELARTIAIAQHETGASKVWIGGHSKGTIDMRWLLQRNPAVRDSVLGAFSIVGPHQGGLTSHAGVADAIRGFGAVLLPGRVQGWLGASNEMLTGSGTLRELNDTFEHDMADAPEDWITNFVSNAMPAGLPGHDGAVPFEHQKLPDVRAVREIEVNRGARGHVTVPFNPQVREDMAEIMGVNSKQ